ncbi:MAG: response regulator [Oscillospiraceae bacterium]|nr:response regulator [Oscillospiraceae bacterium]
MQSCASCSKRPNQKKVFVVDDNDTHLMLAASALEAEYDVLTMHSAAKMFSLLEKKQPDLILLDIEMPEMDGLEAMAKLKASPQWSGIPVIFITGLTDDKRLSRAVEAGALEVIMKPFAPAILFSRVKYCLDM